MRGRKVNLPIDPFFLINEPVIKEGQVAGINCAGILLGPNPGQQLLETISQEREIDVEVFAVSLELLKRLKMGLPIAQGRRDQDAHQRVLSSESVSSLGSLPHAGGRSKAPPGEKNRSWLRYRRIEAGISKNLSAEKPAGQQWHPSKPAGFTKSDTVPEH